ncbi:MAG: tannase/feruloyl esterase family alpha/beta hydrolase, partial [Deltaproteobacteria bacterium]|nr:tannase/feruloyl esterase family alpha/beta hydrolase [Deltaproteobacteria bacterium]
MVLFVFPVKNSLAADIKANVSQCSDIAKLAGPGFVVEKAEIVPAGPIPGPGGNGDQLPEHCLIQGMINPRTGAKGQKFGIGFELRMPTNWNNRFFFQGGGGLDGVLSPAIGSHMGAIKPSALARGFAVVSTDGGHRSSMLDGTFGLDQQARIDYGYNALDKVTLKAKEL